MQRMPFKTVTIGLVVATLAVALSLVACAPGASKVKVLQLMCGTASVTSGHYPASVAMARIVSQNVPEVNISLVETGGSVDCVGRTGKDLNMFTQTGSDIMVQGYNGVAVFEGKPIRDLRTF